MSTNANKIYSGPVPFQVDCFRTALTELTATICIDLDNATGAYNHKADARGIRLWNVVSHQVQSADESAGWKSFCGFVCRIDGTDADLFSPCACTNVTSVALPNHITQFESRFGYECRINADGTPRNFVGGLFTFSEINTATDLKDAAGNDIRPALGDFICVMVPVGSVDGDVEFARCIQYSVY